jgi:hypothetical protein
MGGLRMASKYKLNLKRDVDIHEHCDFGRTTNGEVTYMLNLPLGFCIWEEGEHTAGFDSMSELKNAVLKDVTKCECSGCQNEEKIKSFDNKKINEWLNEWVGA